MMGNSSHLANDERYDYLFEKDSDRALDLLYCTFQ